MKDMQGDPASYKLDGEGKKEGAEGSRFRINRKWNFKWLTLINAKYTAWW